MLTNYSYPGVCFTKYGTRPGGPIKSFKSYGLTSKTPPLVTILIENDNSTWNKKRKEIF